MKNQIGIFCMILCLLAQATASFALPNTMSWQGRLTDINRDPITTATNISAQIYNQTTGGTLLWEENHAGTNAITPGAGGIYDIILGQYNPIDISFDKNYYLEFIISGEAHSRINITTQAYSFRANIADNIASTVQINATQLIDTINSARLVGSYTGITGLGAITIGIWNANPILQTYLGGISLPSSNITGTWTNGVSVPCGNVTGALSDLCTITGGAGSGAGVTIPSSNVTGTWTGGATLPVANITGAITSVSGLTMANITGAWTNGINSIPFANVTGVAALGHSHSLPSSNITGTWTGGITIPYANITGISTTGLTMANITGVWTNGLTLPSSNITGVWTNGITIPTTNITGVWTGGITVPFSNITAFSVSGLTMANITGAWTNGITVPSANITGVWTGGATLPVANITGAWVGGVTVPASNVSAGTFASGNGGFTFPQNVTVRMNITATQVLVNITATNRMGMCWNGTHTVIGNLSGIACKNNG